MLFVIASSMLLVSTIKYGYKYKRTKTSVNNTAAGPEIHGV
jgi:hypothetical protein